MKGSSKVWMLNKDDVFKVLNSSAEGLSEKEADSRIKNMVLMTFQEEEKEIFWKCCFTSSRALWLSVRVCAAS